jgi:hypothetical protein
MYVWAEPFQFDYYQEDQRFRRPSRLIAVKSSYDPLCTSL